MHRGVTLEKNRIVCGVVRPWWRLVCLLVICLALSLTASAQPVNQPATQPAQLQPRRVLIISVDGLRPDVLLRARTPAMRGLMSRGAFTCWAQTTAASVTLPSHTSMLTGVPPSVHGIDWNRDLPFSEPVYSRVPTIFEVAKKRGMSSALISGKSKFDALAKPGSVDWVSIPGVGKPQRLDDEVAAEAVSIILQHRPIVTFVHLPNTDAVGHKIGWGTPEQLDAVGKADDAIDAILRATREAGIAENLLVIVSADHGGAGLSHGPEDARSRHIPWIVAGPGVVADFDLTRRAELTVKIEDTFSTALDFLMLDAEQNVSGKSILKIKGVMR